MKSIIQEHKECYVCGRTEPLHLHHIFGGTANRKKSDQYGLTMWLCPEHHTGPTGVHWNPEMMDCFHMMAQKKFEEQVGDRDFFRHEFGRSYL